MTKKFLSFIIVPHSQSSFKRITLSKTVVKAFLGGAAFVFVVVAVFLVDYFTMNVTRQKYKEVCEENLKQKETIAGLEDSVRTLEKTVKNFEAYAKKLNIMAGLKSPEVLTEVGVGGGSPENEDLSLDVSPQSLTLSNIKTINQKAENIEKNLSTLVHFFENQTARLASTPTTWPTMGWVTSGFGWRKDPFTGKQAFHYGIDVATNFGNPIVATADGIVVQLKNDKIGGRTVVISHSGGFTTHYLHLEKWLVKAGQKVKRGDVIGLIGKTGKALGPHVHYEVRINGKAVNPYNYILEE